MNDTLLKTILDSLEKQRQDLYTLQKIVAEWESQVVRGRMIMYSKFETQEKEINKLKEELKEMKLKIKWKKIFES